MRCLHCGKDIPLFKRLSGGEFCSEAHRRDYQQEYSDLALSRLLQAHPQRKATPTLETIRLEQKDLGTVVSPPLSIAPPVTPSAAPFVAAQNGHSAPPLATPDPVATQGLASSLPASQPYTPPPPVQAEPEAAAPAGIANAMIQKPPAVGPNVAPVMSLPEGAALVISMAPNRPSHEAVTLPTEFALAVPVDWKEVGEIQNWPARPIEPRLELRSVIRSAPVLDFELRIDSPQEWSAVEEPLQIPTPAGFSPAQPTLWQAPVLDFALGMVALGDFVEGPLPPSGSGSMESGAPGQTAEPAAASQEIPATVPAGKVHVADKLRKPVPLALQGIAAGRAKPMQVFTSWLPNGQMAQMARPETLPLRPVMVLAPAESETASNSRASASGSVSTPVTPPSVAARKAEVRILPPEKPVMQKVATAATPVAPHAGVGQNAPPRVELPRGAAPVVAKPAGAVPVTVAAPPPVRDDLGIPEFRSQPSRFAIKGKIKSIMGLISGAGNEPGEDVPVGERAPKDRRS